eukprot:scaffold662944_cov57-Prasinocladus_malaysianus.AAC.1
MEIQQAGQTLVDIATGKAVRTSAMNSAQNQVSGDIHVTQKLIRDYGQDNLAVARLSGSLAFTVADAQEDNSTDNSFYDVQDDNETVGLPLETLPGGFKSWSTAVGEASSGSYWQVSGSNSSLLGTSDQRGAISLELSSAFSGLSDARVLSFSMTWWA